MILAHEVMTLDPALKYGPAAVTAAGRVFVMRAYLPTYEHMCLFLMPPTQSRIGYAAKCMITVSQ